MLTRRDGFFILFDVGLGGVMDALTPINSAGIWLAILLIGLLGLIYDWRVSNFPLGFGGPFDMPILKAVDHLVRSSSHTFPKGREARHRAAQMLHEAMCAGTLPVVGSRGEFRERRRISARQCRGLRPQEVVVPRNPTTPLGVRLDLWDKSLNLELGVEHSDPIGFTNIRVRSRDLYRLWPKAQDDD